jgi:hypothetical protein
MTNETTLVRRDRFDISLQGVIHKTTDAAFTSQPDDSYSSGGQLEQ